MEPGCVWTGKQRRAPQSDSPLQTPYPLQTLPGRDGQPHPVDTASPPQTVTGRAWVCVHRVGQAWGCPTPPPLPCGEHAAQCLVAEAAPMEHLAGLRAAVCWRASDQAGGQAATGCPRAPACPELQALIQLVLTLFLCLGAWGKESGGTPQSRGWARAQPLGACPPDAQLLGVGHTPH